MPISIIIPVYNAERFLAEAIESVLMQPEVKEILLVEDGSQDKSKEICEKYVASHPQRIRQLQHPQGLNKGAGETRNLGMRNATSEFIAFLDADDVYLRDRFTETMKIFQEHPDAEGVYETVGTMREEHGLSEDVLKLAGSERARLEKTDPSEVFRTLAIAKKGYIHLNGFTIRRDSIDDTLYFDPSLRQCQDTDFLLRWSSVKKLYGVNPDREVAARRVHDRNRVFNVQETMHYRYLCMRKCALNGFYGSHDHTANWQILNRMARATGLVRSVKRLYLPVTPFRLWAITLFLLAHPRVIRSL